MKAFDAAGDVSAPTFYVSVRTPTSSYEERVDKSDRVISMSFEDTEAKADKLALSIDNYDLSQFDSPLWQAGNIVVFSFGYPGAMSPQREMKIQTVKGFSPLQIEALGDEVTFNRRPRTDRKWENVKRSDVVREIAAEYGYTGARAHITDTTIVVDQVTQGRMTDLQLIKSLANRDGFEFYIDFDGLHFKPRNLGQRPMKELWYFTDPGRGDILPGISIEDSRAPGKPGGVVMAGRDPLSKFTFRVLGIDLETLGRTLLAPERTSYGVEELEVIDAKTASTHTEQVESVPVPTTAQDLTVATPEVTKEAAQQSAKGLFTQQQLRAISMTVPCRGDAQVLAKSVVTIRGLNGRLSGNYYVISVNHALGSGYTMTLKVRRDGHGAAVGGGAFKSNTLPSNAKTNDKEPAGPETPAVPVVSEIEVIDPKTATTSVKQLFTGGRTP